MSTTLAELLDTAASQDATGYKLDVLRWMCKFDQHMNFAVTLTMQPEKVNYLTRKGYVTSKAELVVKLKQSMRYFCNRLDRIFYKSAAKLHGKTALVIPVIEGVTGDKRLHYHLAIAAPECFTLAEMQEIVQREWGRTFLGGHEVDVQEYTSSGWLGYISKEVKPTHENVDWGNVRVPKEILQTLY